MSNKRTRKASDVDVIYDGHLNPGQRFRTNPAQSRTALTERMYTRILSEMCMNRFKWTGLEKTSVDVRFMELTLFRYGLSVMFKHKATAQIIAAQATPTGNWNYAQNPVAYTVNGSMMRSMQLKARHVVPIWSNYLRQPDTDIVYLYAKRLAELDRTIDIASDNARRPMVAFVNESQRLSVDNLINQIREGQPVVRVNADLYQGATLDQVLTSVDFGSDPNAIEKLHIVRTRIWGECMGLLGFDFANQDKKERLVASEVDANNSQVDSMRTVNLNARQDAARHMKDLFGLDVQVEYNIMTQYSAAEPPESPSLGMSEE
ncbi:upper collar protein [Curtobacterium phage Reje]|uniref:upper collar protein n=1 Tax=Curtobacterium phage Reje TaxID=2851069 RepID=UPI00220C9575|nr:upper collar protein [Curtobacterium phage Reje]QXG07816.1 upper collar protein [Curtobacterium phage Reje]